MSLSERAKTKPDKFTDLGAWLDTLPTAEREGAEFMLSNPQRWSVQEILSEFRDDALKERGETLVFGKDQVYRWRRFHGVIS
jgi:hypothetical protein